jgi:hypothetical protein
MIHTGDPAAFFTPLDKNNERWHELNQHPDWLFYGQDFPDLKTLLDSFVNAVAKHPRTTFIGAHFGNDAEDIATVGRWLDQYPNLYIDIDARISELGRQPYSTRKFLIKYQDRVMFGTDTSPKREAYRIYYRFLETDDEYFDCRESHHLQGFWMIDGVFLPKEALEKIYNKNAERVLYFGDDKNAASSSETGTKAAEEKAASTPRSGKSIRVARTEDFEIAGDGSAAAWRNAAWTLLEKLPDGHHDYDVRFKMLYSATGVYVLMTGSDRRVTASIGEDFANLWNEDVFEFFFWPDESQTIYFEYEISPLGHELALLVPNLDHKQLGWRPWHFEGARKTRKAVAVAGGKAASGEAIDSWTAEVFVPYELLKPLKNVPPQPGTRWRANFYRVDYDDHQETAWAWSPVGGTFHEYEKYGTVVFE